MKKLNPINGRNDTAPHGAQAKRPAASHASKPAKSHPRSRVEMAKPPRQAEEFAAEMRAFLANQPVFGDEIVSFDEQRLFRKGTAYHLVTSYGKIETEGSPITAGETVQALSRAEARDWLDRTVIKEMIPHEFHREFRHREGSEHAELERLTLGELLERDSLNGLTKLGAEGLPIAAQVSGAVVSWLSFAEHLKVSLPNGADHLRAAPGILDCAHYEHVLARRRQQWLTVANAKFFRELVERGKRLPWDEAMEFMEQLADLIEHHPGLADEWKALRELLGSECVLGKSTAVETTLKE